MSYTSTLKKIDEMGKDFDAVVLQWKHHIEHDCKKKKMLQTIVECAEDMVEIVPVGMDTVDVSGLNLSFVDSPTPSLYSQLPRTCNYSQERANKATAEVVMDVDGEYQKPVEPPVLAVNDPQLKAAVLERVGTSFEEAVFEETLNLIVDYGCEDLQNVELLKTLTKQLELCKAAGYQITGDNLDMLVKVKHMSSTNQNKSIHWFNLNAVMHRVIGNDLRSDGPIRPVLEMENIEFLPSVTDNYKFLGDVIPLAARVIVNRIPAFSSFKDVVVKHIPHTYSDAMKEKSAQVFYLPKSGFVCERTDVFSLLLLVMTWHITP